MLAAWLGQQGSMALVAFCDFRKAYDTIDRQFLFDVAAALGLGEGFIAWMKLLLSNTRSAAILDGYLSDFRLFQAGVRQGCPLAPLLYLLVAQAALSWLKSQGIGVEVDSQLITAAQFADDLKVLLNSVEQVPTFVDAMTVFAEASGQHMLPAKTKLLPLGTPPEHPLPESIQGLPVVDSVKALGLHFAAYTGEATADWHELITKVHGKIGIIMSCQLSMFGIAAAINGFALSKFLFHAQFVGLPPPTLWGYLQRLVAAAVDRKIVLRLPNTPATGENQSQRKFTHLSKELLVGHPTRGGVGLLPLEHHIKSRLAWWGCRLLTGSDAVPWIKVGRAVLGRLLSQFWMTSSTSAGSTPRYETPRLQFLYAVKHGFANYLGLPEAQIPKVFLRMAEGLAALPRPVLMAPVPPGPWCSQLCLWSNPLLLNPARTGLEWPSNLQIEQLVGPGLTTVGDLIRTRLELEELDERSFLQMWHHLRYPGRPEGIRLAALPHRLFTVTRTLVAVKAVVDRALIEIASRMPDGWIEAAQVAGTVSPADTEEIILSSLGWRTGRKRYTLASVTVKAGTILQLQQQDPPQKPKMERFAELVGPDTPTSAVQHMLARLWRRPCDGKSLTCTWHLVLNGVASSERLDFLQNRQCGCNTCLGPNRVHLYYECPILEPLLQSVAAQFQGDWVLPAHRPLQRHHIWLATRPHRDLHQGLWDIVVIKIIAAFYEGHKNWMDRVMKLENPQQRRNNRSSSRHRPAMAPGPEMISSVSTVVLATFWGDLADIIALDVFPRDWLQVVPLDHPFIHPDPERRIWQLSKVD